MADTYYDYPETPTFQGIFEGAKDFGLKDEEIWRVVNETQHYTGPDTTVEEYLDQLAGTLAHRIVIQERRTRSGRI